MASHRLLFTIHLRLHNNGREKGAISNYHDTKAILNIGNNYNYDNCRYVYTNVYAHIHAKPNIRIYTSHCISPREYAHSRTHWLLLVRIKCAQPG